jgi:hypothetical protein
MDSLNITIHYVNDFVHVGKRNTISREKAWEAQCSGMWTVTENKEKKWCLGLKGKIWQRVNGVNANILSSVLHKSSWNSGASYVLHRLKNCRGKATIFCLNRKFSPSFQKSECSKNIHQKNRAWNFRSKGWREYHKIFQRTMPYDIRRIMI